MKQSAAIVVVIASYALQAAEMAGDRISQARRSLYPQTLQELVGRSAAASTTPPSFNFRGCERKDPVSEFCSKAVWLLNSFSKNLAA